ncbi:hypothetical protein Tco_0253030 [Tanacetum coccineum]
MRPFGCHVTILNTLDHLGKFDGFFVGYSLNSKAFRVYNIRTMKVEENLHVRFLEDKPIIASDGLKWLFDIDVLTKSMNYIPVVAGTNSNDFVGTKESIGAGHPSKEPGSSQDYILMLGECAISNFNHGSTFCKISMLHVPPENNEFEGEIIPCSDFRLGTSQPRG